MLRSIQTCYWVTGLLAMTDLLHGACIAPMASLYFDGTAQATASAKSRNWPDQSEASGRLDISYENCDANWSFGYTLLVQADGYCDVYHGVAGALIKNDKRISVKILDKNTVKIKWTDASLSLKADPIMKKFDPTYDPSFGNSFEITLVQNKKKNWEWQAAGSLEVHGDSITVITDVNSEPGNPLLHLDCDYEGSR